MIVPPHHTAAPPAVSSPRAALAVHLYTVLLSALRSLPAAVRSANRLFARLPSTVRPAIRPPTSLRAAARRFPCSSASLQATVRRFPCSPASLRATVRRVRSRAVSLPAVVLRGIRRALHRTPAARRRREAHARAAEAARYAGEVRVAAVRAAEAADCWRESRLRAEEHTGDTWQAWQDAEECLARTRAAAAFRSPRSRRTVAELAARARFLRLAVFAAVDRGDLPDTVMADLVSGDGGWNPGLHPVDQELVLHRAIAAVRHHRYREALAAEQVARHDAQLALAARDGLRDELTAALAAAARAPRSSAQRLGFRRSLAWIRSPLSPARLIPGGDDA